MPASLSLSPLLKCDLTISKESIVCFRGEKSGLLAANPFPWAFGELVPSFGEVGDVVTLTFAVHSAKDERPFTLPDFLIPSELNLSTTRFGSLGRLEGSVLAMYGDLDAGAGFCNDGE